MTYTLMAGSDQPCPGRSSPAELRAMIRGWGLRPAVGSPTYGQYFLPFRHDDKGVGWRPAVGTPKFYFRNCEPFRHYAGIFFLPFSIMLKFLRVGSKFSVSNHDALM
jgi:hypothetical protein